MDLTTIYIMSRHYSGSVVCLLFTSHANRNKQENNDDDVVCNPLLFFFLFVDSMNVPARISIIIHIIL